MITTYAYLWSLIDHRSSILFYDTESQTIRELECFPMSLCSSIALSTWNLKFHNNVIDRANFGITLPRFWALWSSNFLCHGISNNWIRSPTVTGLTFTFSIYAHNHYRRLKTCHLTWFHPCLTPPSRTYRLCAWIWIGLGRDSMPKRGSLLLARIRRRRANAL